MGETLGSDYGADRGSYNLMLGEEVAGKLEVYPLGELLSADVGAEIGSSNVRTYGNGDLNLEENPLSG